MKMFARIAFLLVAALMVMGLVAGCDGGGASTPPAAEKKADAPKPAEPAPTPAATPAEPAAPATPAPAPADAPKTDAAAPASTPAAPAAGAALDAKTIVGTKWSVMGKTLAFQDNGVLKIDDAEGTWKLDGTKLTVDVGGGQTYEAAIEGDKITYNGVALEKVN